MKTLKMSGNTFRTSLGVILAVVALATASTTDAITVNYSVDDWRPTSFPGPISPPATASHMLDGLGYPGDSVELQSYAGTLNLVPGTTTQKINTLLWNVAYTYAGAGDPLDPDAGWQTLSFTFNPAWSMTIDGGGSQTLSQDGSLNVQWDNDYLALTAGSTISFTVQGYQVDVTPLAVPESGASLFPGFPGGTPWAQPNQDVLAQFDISTVPEPSTITLLGTGFIGLLIVVRRRNA